MKKTPGILTDAERQTLESLLATGTLPARTFKRATAVLELDRGKPRTAVAATLAVDDTTVAAGRQRSRARGLDGLHAAPRSGRPIVIAGPQRATITARACRASPAGYARWTVRLLAENVVAAGCCATIAHTMVGTVLTKPP